MRFRNLTIFASLLALGFSYSANVSAQVTDNDETQIEAQEQKTLNAATIEQMPDNSPIVLTGTIKEIRGAEFDLFFQGETIPVEIGQLGWSADEAAQYLSTNSLVIVTGHIKDTALDERKIIASKIRQSESALYSR